jgi:hypothetical protein
MNEFLSSIKADLLDRRMLPLVAVVAVALAAAVAYAVVGGGASTSTPPAAVAQAPVAGSSGVAISQVTPEQADAEMTSGVAKQHHGTARDPFTPLPAPKVKAASTASSTSTSASSTSSSSTSSTGGSTETTPTPATPSKPAHKPKPVYHVAVLFGVLPAGTTAQTAQLTPFENLALLTPLPSAKQPLIVFRGVTAGGKSATFTLVGEAILHGSAACLPSATQCEAIDLQAGRSEQLEYVSPSGVAELYELRIVSITSGQATAAAVKSLFGGQSKAGRELLRHAGLTAIPGMHFSAQAGVLVFVGHHAFAARAHAAAHSHTRR